MILPLRTAAITAALRRATHLLVLGGGRSSIGGARSAECSITLFTRNNTPRDQDGSQRPFTRGAFSNDEIGCVLPPNVECGQCRFMFALIQNTISCAELIDNDLHLLIEYSL